MGWSFLLLACQPSSTVDPVLPGVGEVPASGETIPLEGAVLEVPADAQDTSALPPPFRGDPVACADEIYVAQAGNEDDPLVLAEAHAEAYGTAPVPVRTHLSWTGDPTSTATLVWLTDIDTYASRVEIGVGLGYGYVVEGRSFPLDTDVEDGRVHEVRVCGMEPGTTWHYRVGGEGGWSADASFTTAPAAGSTDTFTFGVAGDSRGNTAVWTQVLAGMETHGAEFRIFTGDAVSSGSSVSDWESWFDAGAGYVDTRATMLAHGNHEGLALQYFALNAMPGNEQWYSFDYGNAHFVSVNDTPANSADWEEEKQWLAQDLGSSDQPWKFVFHHQPPYSSSTVHAESATYREDITPIEEEGRVRIDFAGHNHFYERIAPLTAGQEDPVHGVTYVITAGGGASLYGNDSRNWYTRVAVMTEHYTVVRIQDDILSLIAYDLGGNIIDSMALQSR